MYATVPRKTDKKDRDLAKYYLKQFEDALKSGPADGLTERIAVKVAIIRHRNMWPYLYVFKHD